MNRPEESPKIIDKNNEAEPEEILWIYQEFAD